MTSQIYGRGRLTDDDHRKIDELAAKGMTAGRIAQLIKRHSATVQWYLYSAGIRGPRPTPEKPISYMRGNRMVRHFSRDEDVFIEALRVQGFSFREIANFVNKRFSTERTFHTIQCRLIMLAARETA
jgi:IS30 family transposase